MPKLWASQRAVVIGSTGLTQEINDKIMNILKILLHKYVTSSEVNDELTNETSEDNRTLTKTAS